jgi:hypothetical protein
MTIVQTEVMHCKYCWEASMARLLANPSLPVGQRSVGLDFHLNDPRIRNVSTQKEIFLPVLVDYGKVNGKLKAKSMVISVYDFVHMKTFLKQLHNIL